MNSKTKALEKYNIILKKPVKYDITLKKPAPVKRISPERIA